MNNTKIVGTTHITPKKLIIKEIEEFKPDIIGVELCETRLKVMIEDIKPELNMIEDTSLIGKIANAIKKKANENNLDYGSDMISASKYALANKIQLVCLDRDIMELRSLMEKIPEKEALGFMTELGKFEEANIKQEIDANKVLKELKEKYPVSFEFLINSRDLTIENNILKLILKNPDKRILVFIGKGHLIKIQKDLDG